ncbi:MAG: DedA family protein [Bacteroidaceae bacterium]|nr:DedA family protein [Bacteroidaceae bacterium]
MATFLALLESWGYVGMLVAAFIAGSVFPFSSEAVLTALQLAGLEPVRLFCFATTGNVAGSMFNYGVGTLGKMEWIERYLHVEPTKVEQTARWMERYGAWIGLLCFLPILGSVIAVTLGFTRANPWLSLLTITIGKATRYAILIFAVSMI